MALLGLPRMMCHLPKPLRILIPMAKVDESYQGTELDTNLR